MGAPAHLEATPVAQSPGKNLPADSRERESWLLQGSLAILRVAQTEVDCSGVGHLQLVLDVAAPSTTRARRVHAACPLSAGDCPVIGGNHVRPGALLVGSLRTQHSPARTIHCVSLPPTDAELSCGVSVATEVEGLALLTAATGHGQVKSP